MESSTTNDLLEATNTTMAMATTNNNTTTLAWKSPLKCLHNEWRCFGHQKQPNKAASKALDFTKAVAAHGVCYGLTVKKQMQCNCLAELSSQMDDGPSFVDCVIVELVGFVFQDMEQQQNQLIKEIWVRYS